MPVTRAIHIIGNDRGHGPDDDDRDIDRRMGRGRGDGTQGRRRSGRSRVEVNQWGRRDILRPAGGELNSTAEAAQCGSRPAASVGLQVD